MREIMPKENIFIQVNRENYYNVLNQIKDIEKKYDFGQISIEPEARNTAPAITLAVKYLESKFKVNPDAPIIFLPADHFIGNKEKYLNTVNDALKNVGDRIGTIGIVPDRPETGYGYIKKGEKIGSGYKVAEFKEKPNIELAKKYVDSKEYLWNSGMYLFNSKTLLKELERYQPEVFKLASEGIEKLVESFSNLPSISIDVAISEKSDNVFVFEGDFGWNDIGSFESLAEVTPKNPDLIALNSNNVFAHSRSNKLVATIGVNDLIIVESNDCILVHKKGEGQNVKKITDYLKEKNRKELEDILVVHRPWGKYEILIDTPIYKVKRLTVYPEAKLSTQSHFHRVEHWIVVKGIAKVKTGNNEVYLRENESTFIPNLTTHSLENPGKINLEVIEVQTGSYLEEDDIIRYDDQYGRATEDINQ